jgi:hypothetical protein
MHHYDMQMSNKGISLTLLFIGAGVGSVLSLPLFAYAQPGAANAMCTPVRQECGCGMIMTSDGCKGGSNMYMCPCQETVNGKLIKGICMAQNKCEGQQGEGLDSGAMGMLSQLLQQAMQQLMKGGGGGGGAGEMPTTTYGGTGCVTYYQVTVPSSDPCAIYNPSPILPGTTGGSSVADGLLDALGGSSSQTPSNVSDKLIDATKNTTPTGTQTTTTTKTNTTTNASSTVKAAAPGLSGDVRIGSAGATIIANLRQGMSEVAGFFGGSTGGASQALSAAGRLCASRPWAGSFVSNVIPTSFFDGLCEWRGYQAGMAMPTNTSKTSTITPTSGSTASQTSGNSFQPSASNVPPEVDIWAEPASVRLGTRTYIFWNARGVASCKGSGPSFSQNTLSGGASTVPITGPTTFTIECLTTASTTVQDSVTVQIAI